MANSPNRSFLLFFACLMAVLSLMLNPVVSDQSPGSAPEPAAAADSPSPSPSPSSLPPSLQAPMVPSPHLQASAPAPANSPFPSTDLVDSPSPAPTVSSAVSHNGLEGDDEAYDSASKGMSGGKKAGIAFGVILSACVVGLAGIIYIKRQQNIRRAQFGYAARHGFL